MPSSAVRAFTDPDDYAAAIRGANVELTVTGRGDFTAKLTRIDLRRLWMQRYSESLPRICDVTDIASARLFIAFRTTPGPSLFQGGTEIQVFALLQAAETDNLYQHSSGATEFANMSLPIEDLAAVGGVMAGVDLPPPRDAALVVPSSSAMAKLQRLHAAAGSLAEDAPEIIAHPEAAQGLEQALIEAMAGCLSIGQVREERLAWRHHSLIMRRFRRAVEENPEEPLYIPDICKAIRVSDRTLRICCHEHLGMGPKRYLLLRRMQLARRALRQAAPDAASVTEIATRYGFWQLGRFAVEYQSLFEESPSATLARLFG